MYTVDETGLMNNYAVEPAIYPAEYPSYEQQQQYIRQAATAALFVTLTVLTAFVVS